MAHTPAACVTGRPHLREAVGLAGPYHVRGTLYRVGNRYSLTPDGLHNIGVYGITPGEVWRLLHSSRRLRRQMTEDTNAVFGVTPDGRYLVVFVVESMHEDNDWDVIAAREMYPDEIAMFEKYVGGQR
jgi:hypothetical protein